MFSCETRTITIAHTSQWTLEKINAFTATTAKCGYLEAPDTDIEKKFYDSATGIWTKDVLPPKSSKPLPFTLRALFLFHVLWKNRYAARFVSISCFMKESWYEIKWDIESYKLMSYMFHYPQCLLLLPKRVYGINTYHRPLTFQNSRSPQQTCSNIYLAIVGSDLDLITCPNQKLLGLRRSNVGIIWIYML